MSFGAVPALLFVLGTLTASVSAQSGSSYYGLNLGPLSELEHGVKGKVYAVDSRTLYLKDFYYDGAGPAAYFYVGTSKSPNAAGAVRLRDERGNSSPLRRYRGESVTLSLPDGHTLKDFKWFAIWCDEYSVNFGDITIPRDSQYPKPARVTSLKGIHGVSSDPVVVVDAQTLLVPNFSYDGEAPDAKFWVGRGSKPSPRGIRIPDENGKEQPLRKYDKKTIVLTLPGELTVFDIGHFGVWCEAFTVDFGHVELLKEQLSHVPPSLKMLGVSPQSRNKALVGFTSSASKRLSHVSSSHVDATTYRPSRLGVGPLAALLDQPSQHQAHLHRRANNPRPANAQLLQRNEQEYVQTTEKYRSQYIQQDQPTEEYAQYQQQIQQQLQYHPQYQEIHYQPQYQPVYQQINPNPYQTTPRQENYQRPENVPVQYRLVPYGYNERTIVSPIQRSIDLDLNDHSGSQ